MAIDIFYCVQFLFCISNGPNFVYLTEVYLSRETGGFFATSRRYLLGVLSLCLKYHKERKAFLFLTFVTCLLQTTQAVLRRWFSYLSTTATIYCRWKQCSIHKAVFLRTSYLSLILYSATIIFFSVLPSSEAECDLPFIGEPHHSRHPLPPHPTLYFNTSAPLNPVGVFCLRDTNFLIISVSTDFIIVALIRSF